MIFEIICILGASGHYDCSWDLITIEQTHPYFPCGENANGCTLHHEKRIYMTPQAHFQKDAWGNSVLWHEITHAMCGCNWHDGGERLW